MRKRSMSVFVSRDDNRLSKRFEGVSSDVEAQSDSEDEEITTKEEDHISESWTKADYAELVEKLRGALPKKDVKKAKSTLQNIKWEDIEIRQHSPDDIRQVAHTLVAKIRTFRTLGEMLNDVPDVVAKILSVDKPKMPLSAYTIFMKEQIPKWKAENEDFKAVDAFKIASKAFHELSAKKKKKYEDAAAQSKAEYQAKLAKYYEDHPDMVPVPKPSKGSNRAPRNRDPASKIRRERTRTPFNLFYESRLEKDPTILMLQCRQEWEQLPVKSKLPFIRKSFETTDDVAEASKLLNKKEQEMLDRYHGKPDFVGRNAFEYFRRQNRAKYEGELGGKEREQKLCDEYKQLTERQLLDLKVAFLAAREKYVKQYQAYIKELPEDKQKAEIEYLQGQIASAGGNKKDKSRKKHKEEDMYPGSADEDPPVAESTTIKKPPKETKKPSKKKHAPPVEENDEDDDDVDDPEPMPSPTKRTKMEPPPSPKKTVTSTPKPKPEPIKESKSKKGTKTTAGHNNSSRMDSSSADDSEPSTSRNGSRKRTPEVVPIAAKVDQVDGKRGKKTAAATVAKKEKLVAVPPTPTLKEPERPPTVLEEFYRQRVYKGKVGKHKESFANLSAAKRREISDQMKAAQKQYIVEFETFLKSLPKDQIRQYIQKVNSTKKASAPADDDSEEEEESETGSSDSEEDEEDDD